VYYETALVVIWLLLLGNLLEPAAPTDLRGDPQLIGMQAHPPPGCSATAQPGIALGQVVVGADSGAPGRTHSPRRSDRGGQRLWWRNRCSRRTPPPWPRAQRHEGIGASAQPQRQLHFSLDPHRRRQNLLAQIVELVRSAQSFATQVRNWRIKVAAGSSVVMPSHRRLRDLGSWSPAPQCCPAVQRQVLVIACPAPRWPRHLDHRWPRAKEQRTACCFRQC